MKTYSVKKLQKLLGISTLFFSSFALSEIEATAQVNYIDNPNRAPGGVNSDILYLLKLRGNYQRETERYYAQIDYRASKIDYEKNSLQDRDILEGYGVFNWALIPDRLTWNFNNSRVFNTVDVFQPDITDNRQVVENLSTGPSLNLPFGNNLVSLSAQKSWADYSRIQSFEQEREFYNAEYTRIVSNKVSLILRANLLETEFETSPLLNYDTLNTTIGFDITGEKYRLSISAGENRTKRQSITSDITNNTYSFEGAYEISENAEVSASYIENVLDLLQSIGGFGQQLPFFNDINPESLGNSNVADIAKQKIKKLSYIYAIQDQLSINMSYIDTDRNFERTGIRQLDTTYSFTINYNPGSRSNLSLYGSYTELEQLNLIPLQERQQFGITGEYSFSDRFSTQLGISHIDQNGQRFIDKYSGWNAYISIIYRR